MVERAKELNWRAIRVKGSDKFKEQIVEEARVLNIRVFDENGKELTAAVKGKALNNTLTTEPRDI